MIVCDYLDENVKNYLKEKRGKTVVTFFKEPFSDYGGNRILFIDDILNESDYQQIDESVNEIIEVTENVFSNYLNVEGYNLFHYRQVNGKRNLARGYKYKYAIDKIAKRENETNLFFFSREKGLLGWLEQEHTVKNLYRDTSMKPETKASGKKQKTRKKFWIAIDSLFKRGHRKPNHMLWLGGRSIKSKLPYELEKDFEIFLLPQPKNYQSHFKEKGIKYRLLRLGNRRKFRRRWRSVERGYREGLKKIATRTKLTPELLELFLRINSKRFKKLLLNLSILEDNRDRLGLLFVEQSVIGMEALAVDYFNRQGLPSLELLDGILSEIIEAGNTTMVAVYGQRDKILLSNYGVDRMKIAITGCPYYDRFFEIEEGQKTSEFLLLILDWISTFPSSCSQRDIFIQVRNMLRLLQHFKNERLVIKLHPNQGKKEMEYVQSLVEGSNLRACVEVKKDEDLTNLLKRAKIVFTYTSSVGVEALLMKKPLIVLDFFPGRTLIYEEYGGCLVAKDSPQLIRRAKEILNNIDEYWKNNIEKIEKTRRYFSADLRGESYKKVADLCKETISNYLRGKE